MQRKVWMILVFCLLLLPIVKAAPVWELVYARVYVDNTRMDNADEGGGTIEALSGHEVKFAVRIKNVANGTIQSRLLMTSYELDNGNDLDKTTDWVSTDKGDERSMTLTIVIPSDARNTEYDTRLTIRGKRNDGSNQTDKEIDFTLDTTLTTGAATSNYFTNVQNMTSTCMTILRQNTILLNQSQQALRYKDSWSICEADKQVLIERMSHCNKDYNQSCAERDKTKIDLTNIQSSFTNCQAQVGTMFTGAQCDQKIAAGKSEQQGTFFWIGGAIAALIYFGWIRKKRIEPAIQTKAPWKP